MRILIHGINFSPELTGIGKYTGEMAYWLAEQGHEVRVITAPPYYPQWKIADGYINGWRKEVTSIPQNVNKQQGSLHVYRCPLWIPAKLSGAKRILHLISFAISSLPIMLAQIGWRSDVVWVVEPPLACAPQAWLVAKLSGGKSWLHIQDFEVDAAFNLGILNSALLQKIVLLGEKWLMKRFDRVSTISQRMMALLIAKDVTHEKTILFPNWVDIAAIVPKEQDTSTVSAYRQALSIEADAVVALYSGNMGAKQGLEILAQAANLLRNSAKLVFVFCGNGAGRESLEDSCADLPNVRFIDLQPLERLSELLAMADIHLLPQRADAADLVMPSKLTGMLASGRPVVATANANTELYNVVTDCGLVVPPEQPQAFADAILKLVNNPSMRTHLGRAGRVYAEKNLDKNAVLGIFEEQLKTLLGTENKG